MIGKEKEIWKDIPNYEGYYQVSNLGKVRSLDRWVTFKNGRKQFYGGRVLKGSLSSGYRQTAIKRNNKGRTFKVSQLVAMAFLGHIPDGHKLVVDHIDGNKLDDRAENLRIVTHRSNVSTCFRIDNEELSSQYAGVRWHSIASKWRAEIHHEGVRYSMGLFNDELKASRAYQAALSKIESGTFNPEDYITKFTSNYKGVTFHKDRKNWQAQITINGKQKNLGSFKTEIEAHNAYKLATDNYNKNP